MIVGLHTELVISICKMTHCHIHSISALEMFVTYIALHSRAKLPFRPPIQAVGLLILIVMGTFDPRNTNPHTTGNSNDTMQF